MLQIGSHVKHARNENLTDGYIKSLSSTGKTAIVTWGAEETQYDYKGTRYLVQNLITIKP
jgi:hypothetical protein